MGSAEVELFDCAKTIVFGRLLMIDCSKCALMHCLLGLFG